MTAAGSVARCFAMAMASKLLPSAAGITTAAVSSSLSCKLSPAPTRLHHSLHRCRLLSLSLTAPVLALPTLGRRPFSTVSSALAQAEQEQQVSNSVDPRMPITVITGFLGSGKTTLLNHILTAEHGIKIAVIENEFGEVGIDGSLVATQALGDENLVMMNNGCLCCTVRGDLVKMLGELMRKRRQKVVNFDHILIETTGLANPAPIIQTFYFDEKLAHHLRLDGVVTVVDAKHAQIHIDEVKPDGVVNEAVEQIAYADRIILNKTDLVGESEQEDLLRQIKRINGMAQMQKTKYGVVDVDYVMGVGGFDLSRIASDVEAETSKATESHSHHEHEHHEHHEHHAQEEHHVHDEHCGHGKDCHEHEHGHEHEHDHVHDPGVSSVSIVCGGQLDLDKVNCWMENLLSDQSDNIYRMKGVLAIEGFPERYVFQGVHSLFEGSIDRLWNAEEDRVNKLVFIGKKLDEKSLREGFEKCLVGA